MTQSELYKVLSEKVLILDGATGTELQKEGMPTGVCPEQWVLENPEVMQKIHRKYLDAGSDVIYSCTFGANRLKLDEFGLADQTYQLNKDLAEISKGVVGKGQFVAGDISPTGQFVEPFGDLPFEEAVDIYKEQVRGLRDGGVDFFIVETMIDIQEMRAAIIAIKEETDLPVLASMTYDADGFTLTGSDPISASITMQSLGADVVGLNCSTGPNEILGIVKSIKPYMKVPIMAKPNAGLPKLINGETVFEMAPTQFADFTNKFIDAGINMFGGCCGTSPEFISLVAEKGNSKKPVNAKLISGTVVSSARSHLLINQKTPVRIIGERINPTGKKTLQEELKAGIMGEVKKMALEQEKAGATLLDINMGMPGIDEKEMMVKTIKEVALTSSLPLVIDSSNPDVIEAAVRIYPGRALINSISAEEKKMERLLEIVAKYGSAFVFLPISDDGIPKTVDDRIKVIEDFYKVAQGYGIVKDDIVVDGLVMTVSAEQSAGRVTMETVNWCANEFGVNTVLGLSNVSFGLPQRKWINASFISMCIGEGLSMAIANPSDENLMNSKFAADVITLRDLESSKYIDRFATLKNESASKVTADNSQEKPIFDCVVDGDRELIMERVKTELVEGIEASVIVNDKLIPGINKVGDLYDKKIYFLPQLVASADAMKAAFGIVQPYLEVKEEGVKRDKIILATVKGDIHDIGKNIVSLMVKNYGYEVIDLGKNVAREKIIETAIKENAQVIGLSALMTTTMSEMKFVVDLAKERGVKAKIIIGGAVTNQEYADEIGADGWSEDSVAAVKLIQELLAD